MRQGSKWGWRGALVALGAVLALGGSVDASAATPELKGKFSPTTRLVVSEQTGKARDLWEPVPQGTYIRVRGEEIELKPFRPTAPAKK